VTPDKEEPIDGKSPAWRELPDAEKAAYLLAHPTISDTAWTDEQRWPGESREAFVKRVLGRRSATFAEEMWARIMAAPLPTVTTEPKIRPPSVGSISVVYSAETFDGRTVTVRATSIDEARVLFAQRPDDVKLSTISEAT
jgi:hypothetical protein